MEYELKLDHDWLWIVLPMELDHYQAEQIREAVKEKMQERYIKYVVFDFVKTTLMDSSGIGLIAGRYRTLSMRGGQVYVANVNESMRRVLTLAGLYRIVTPWEEVMTVEQADGK